MANIPAIIVGCCSGTPEQVFAVGNTHQLEQAIAAPVTSDHEVLPTGGK